MPETKSSAPAFSPGQPISEIEEDKLGHSALAKELAFAIQHRSPAQGFVIGIEGPWGAGKSSVVNLVDRAVSSNNSSKVRVVRFSPWVVGARDQLLGELFAELIRAAAEIGPPPTQYRLAPRNWLNKKRFQWSLSALKPAQREWFSLFGEFASHLGQLGALGIALGVVDPISGGLSLFGLIGQVVAKSDQPKSMLEIKQSIDKALQQLGGRIVVIVDDLDRLEPAEAVEVLRIVRSVADFANVSYMLCYDRSILASALKTELRVPDGDEFLQKVIQLPVPVPQPESFRLRAWFNDGLIKLFSAELAMIQSDEDRDPIDRLARVIDLYGGRYLRTPRNVILTLNSLSLQLPSLATSVDVADLVFINLVRHGNPALYQWIEKYLSELAALANGALVGSDEREKSASELQSILRTEGLDVTNALYGLIECIPGLHYEPIGEKKGWVVFSQVSRKSLTPLAEGKRLGSPDHHRLYFAYSQPEGSIPDSEVSGFADELESDLAAAKRSFQKATSALMPGKVLRAQRLLDQLFASKRRLSEKQLSALLECIADALDDAAKASPEADFDISIWRRGLQVVSEALGALGEQERARIIPTMFREGRSIGFLSQIIRQETFSHGLHGNRKKPESEWTLSEEEFRLVREIMLTRYSNIRPDELTDIPEAFSLLFRWMQIGGQKDAKAKVASVVATEEGLLRFLEICRGWRSSSKGVSRPLRGADLQNFLDVDLVKKRLEDIEASPDSSDAVRQRARRLLTALQEGERA